MRASLRQCWELLAWAQRFPQRRCAIESANGHGYLLANSWSRLVSMWLMCQPRWRPGKRMDPPGSGITLGVLRSSRLVLTHRARSAEDGPSGRPQADTFLIM